jgi:hypothetical protein
MKDPERDVRIILKFGPVEFLLILIGLNLFGIGSVSLLYC